ncbi:hypothetical protein HYQ44_003792 [Verticillium longisporum]|nr:hypothetical protein HYQ44_003792 [Verticillium longisporum]
MSSPDHDTGRPPSLHHAGTLRTFLLKPQHPKQISAASLTDSGVISGSLTTYTCTSKTPAAEEQTSLSSYQQAATPPARTTS